MSTPLREIISASLGKIPLTLLILNADVLNVYTGETIRGSIGVYRDTIVHAGPHGNYRAKNEIDAGGAVAIPGLVDTHLHIESTMMTPSNFAEAVLPRGTTTVCADPHEIVNVLGIRGLRMMLDNAKGAPMKIYFFTPTCVPESFAVTSGSEVNPRDVERSLDWDGVVGLGEVMDYDAVLGSKEKMIEILGIGRRRNAVIDGHCPLLVGEKLSAYVSSGAEADHENFEVASSIEKLRNGLYLKLRGPDVLDTGAFVSALRSLPSPWNVILVTDDVMPDRLERFGHLDNVCRSMIQSGMDPVEVVRSATLKPAQHMRMYRLGAVAPGKVADIVLMKGLREFVPRMVISMGSLIAKDGRMLVRAKKRPFGRQAFHTVRVRALRLEDFVIKMPVQNGKIRINCIDFARYTNVVESKGSAFFQMVLTKLGTLETNVRDGRIESEDISSVFVFERHGKNGNRGFGFVRNLLQRGAIATTVAHDSHNLLVVGRDPSDMLKAANLAIESGGGIVAVQEGKILASIELPIAGLMSEEPLQRIAKKMSKLREGFRKMGVIDHPYMPIPCLLTLSVIPHARITDRGIYDVDGARFVPPFVN